MKTSTTTQLQLEKLDRVALDNLREALPHYTKLTDIAVSGTPLTNQDAIVDDIYSPLMSSIVTSCVAGVGIGWVFQFLFLSFEMGLLFSLPAAFSLALHLFCMSICVCMCKVDPQTMDTTCSVEALYFLNARQNIVPKRRLPSCIFLLLLLVLVLVLLLLLLLLLWWWWWWWWWWVVIQIHPGTESPEPLFPQQQIHRRRHECHPLRNEDAVALLQSGARDVQMENCELNDATVIAEALLHKSTAALKQLNLRRNRISGE